jgi:putative ABC transport system permease protein
MLSLFLGILAVVVVQAGAETAKSAALYNIELQVGKDGTLQLWLPSDPKLTPMITETVGGRSDTVMIATNQATIGEPGVTPVNPGGAPFDHNGGPTEFRVEGEVAIACDPINGCIKMQRPGDGQQKPRGAAISLMLHSISGDIRQFKPFRPVAGEWFDFAKPPSLAPRLVVNREAAKGLMRHTVPAELQIEGGSVTANLTPQIIGVVDDGSMQPTAYARMDELNNWIASDSGGPGNGLNVLMAPEAADLVRVLEAKLRANGQPIEQLHAEPIRAKEEVASQLALLQWLFLGMASLVLLIGVAGILNVGLATVGERVEEFALRRAVGTPRMLLAGIVLAETMVTGLLTAGAAIGLAAAVFSQVGRFINEPMLQNVEFPWQAGLAGVIAGLVAGLLGGLIPAVRAARIPIATVMRA